MQQGRCDARGHMFEQRRGLLHFTYNDGMRLGIVHRARKVVVGQGREAGGIGQVQTDIDGEVAARTLLLREYTMMGMKVKLLEGDNHNMGEDWRKKE